MTVKEFKEKIVQIKGVSEVESYTLINNYGVTFKKGGHKFDVRYWANCYGVALNYWQIMGDTEFNQSKRRFLQVYANDLSEFIPTIEAL